MMVDIRHLIEIIDDVQNRSVAGNNSQNRRDIQPVVDITDYSLSTDVQRRLTDGQRGLESAAFASNLRWIDEGFRERRSAGHVLRGISVKSVAWRRIEMCYLGGRMSIGQRAPSMVSPPAAAPGTPGD